MAKGFADIDAQCREIEENVRKGIFSPVYLLMGEEPFYIDRICDEIIEHALEEDQRDFNQTICYGTDTDVPSVITAARRFPMFAERQLVVVKEAQAMRNIDEMALYCEKPLDSTVLVLCMKGKTADKRKAFYKSVVKNGVVLESAPVREYEITRWIAAYYTSRGLKIAPDAAALLGEYAGTDLSRIALETDKIVKNLPVGATSVTIKDIAENVGVSRQFSIFELTRELSLKNSSQALRTAAYIGAAPKFAMPMAVSALFTHFYRILKYHALLMKTPRPSNDMKVKALGVAPYFFSEYDTAVVNFPVKKCMAVIALLNEYDFKGKGGNAGEASPAELLVELTAKILNL